MNTEKLKTGMLIKNYKEFCQIIDEPIKNGKSKVLQLKDWTRYFDYHKNGSSQSYIVDEVYDEPYPKDDFRKDVVYSKLIQYVLAGRLALENRNEIDMTKRQLYFYLGMVNSNYVQENDKQNTLAAFCEKHQDILTPEQSFYYYNDFSTCTNRKLDRIIENALSSMEERFLIIRNKRYIIVEKVMENGEQVKKIRPAKDKEISIILKITREYLDEHPEFSFINAYNYKKYYSGLNRLFQERVGWDSVFQSIKIIYSSESLEKYVGILGEELLEECKKNQIELNNVIVERFNNYFQTAYQNNRQKVIEKSKGKMSIIPANWTEQDLIEKVAKNDPKLKYKAYNSDYVEIQREFVDMFINTKGIFDITVNSNKNTIIEE